jgi:hypothetical protein
MRVFIVGGKEICGGVVQAWLVASVRGGSLPELQLRHVLRGLDLWLDFNILKHCWKCSLASTKIYHISYTHIQLSITAPYLGKQIELIIPGKMRQTVPWSLHFYHPAQFTEPMTTDC